MDVLMKSYSHLPILNMITPVINLNTLKEAKKKESKYMYNIN